MLCANQPQVAVDFVEYLRESEGEKEDLAGPGAKTCSKTILPYKDICPMLAKV